MKQNEPQNGWQKSGESQSGVKAMGEGTAISLLSLQIQAQLSSAEELVKALSQLLPISTTSRQVLGKSIESILSSLSSLNKEADGLKPWRSEEHTSELQSLMRISYAVFCLKKKTY